MRILPALKISLITARRRLFSIAIVTVAAGVAVGLLLATFAIAVGFTRTASQVANPDRRMVIAPSAASEGESVLPRDVVNSVLSRLSVQKTAAGDLIASPELIAFATLEDARTGNNVFATVRGVGPQFASVRPELKIIEGRAPQPGKRELMAGRGIASHVGGLKVGADIDMPTGQWRIVGLFSSAGDPHESELMGDAATIMDAFRRPEFNSITYLPLPSDPSPAALSESLQRDGLRARVTTESAVLQSTYSFVIETLNSLAFSLGTLIVIALVIGILNTLLIAVRKRSTELATLRALGYQRSALILSVIAETTGCGLAGALLGTLAVKMLFERTQVSFWSGVESAQLTFDLHIGTELISAAVAITVAIALAVGSIAAVQVFSMTPATALRRA